jgi:AcrR family transcriptional regulator
MSGVERRAVIAQAAVKLFAERGFRGVTTRELAQRVGVTEPVLYEHFQTKSELYSAIIDATSHQNFDRARIALETSARTDNSLAFFTRLATMIAEHQARNPDYLRLILFSALEKHELASLCFERHATVIHKIVIAFIKERIALGEFRNIDPALAARAFMGMVLHYSLFDQHFGFKLVRSSRKRAIANMVDIFLNGMVAA